MLDVKIDCLRIDMESAPGHEHRIRPIAARAAQVFAERLSEYAGSCCLEALHAAPVSLDLSSTTDEHAAHTIAAAWLEAVALKLH